MKTIIGPQNMIRLEVDQVENFNRDDHTQAIAAASATLQFPPIITLETPDGLFDTAGRKLRSVASQLIECPLHPIPSTEITDFDIDYNERCWVIFADNYISILESTDYSGGISFGVTHGHEWTDLSPSQIPWGLGTKLICVRSVGGNNFESGRIVCMAAAPDDAKYPYIIALAYDKLYHKDVPISMILKAGR